MNTIIDDVELLASVLAATALNTRERSHLAMRAGWLVVAALFSIVTAPFPFHDRYRATPKQLSKNRQ